MSYLRAEDILPKELIETIQQYVNGELIYIPSKEKQTWGSRTGTRRFLHKRNLEIFEKYQNDASIRELSREYSLSVKSIQRIIRNIKASKPDDIDEAAEL